MTKTVEKAKDRLLALERIAEYEKKGWFDKDIEDDPPFEVLNPEDIDFLGKKFTSRVKSKIANICGASYFNGQMRKKHVILKDVTGLENLEGFSGGAIVTCNHMNVFDNYAVYLALKKHFKKYILYKFIREGNYALPGLFGMLMRNCNTLPLSENRRTMAHCIKAARTLLERGEKVLIYPEQGMWWNYRKPRPLKQGAYNFAVRSNVPVIPIFITLSDSDIIGKDGFPVQEFTVNILPLIYPDPELSLNDNCEMMSGKNFALWKDAYERVYGVKLEYSTVENAAGGDNEDSKDKTTESGGEKS